MSTKENDLIVTLSKPVTHEGTEYTEIDLSGLESFTGGDLLEVKQQWTMGGNFSPLPAADMSFCAIAAANAAGVSLALIESLPAKDFTKVTQKVMNFLNS